MRIAYVTSALPFGTSEAFFIPEIEELRRQGVVVRVFPTLKRGPAVHTDAGAFSDSVSSVGLFSMAVARDAVLEFARSPWKVMRLLATVVAASSARVAVKNLAAFPKALWLGRTLRGRVDHVHAQWASVPSTVAMIAAELAGVPWSLTAHRWDIPENNLIHQKGTSATFLRAIDQNGAAELRALGAPAAKVRLIHMGVRVPNAPAAGLAERRELRLVIAANLVEKKGHVFLLEALARLKTERRICALDIVGGGPLRADLEAVVERLGLASQVTFCGVMAHEHLIAQMRSGRWDVMVLPSIVTESGELEGIPVALMEAMANGLPVISTRTGGIAELVPPGCGLLVEQKNVSELADAIRSLAATPESRVTFARNAFLHVSSSFNITRSIAEVLALIRQSAPSEGES